jgi:U3 small nucleolar RNA-associated protein 20
MGVTSNVKVMTVADEVLRRVGGGLERNRGIEQEGANDNPEADWLVNVIWGLVSGNVAFLKEREDWSNPKVKKKRKGIKDKSDHIVERSRKSQVESDQYAHNSYR